MNKFLIMAIPRTILYIIYCFTMCFIWYNGGEAGDLMEGMIVVFFLIIIVCEVVAMLVGSNDNSY